LSHTSDLAELGRFYRMYVKLMDHWRTVLPRGAFLDVSYERLVTDTAAATKDILEYCGLPWDDAVRNFHSHKRPIKTASLAQARQPVYTRSIGRWRNYRKALAPLTAELFATASGPASSRPN
jgi:sulfotransferase family protein